MIEWWEQANEALIKYHFSKSILHNCISKSQINLRDGVDDFLKLCINNYVLFNNIRFLY